MPSSCTNHIIVKGKTKSRSLDIGLKIYTTVRQKIKDLPYGQEFETKRHEYQSSD